MADFVTTNSATGTYSLDATGQNNLLSYLESSWLEGSYMIITLKTSHVATSAATTTDSYNFGTATATGASDDAKLHVTISASVNADQLAFLKSNRIMGVVARLLESHSYRRMDPQLLGSVISCLVLS
jgi:hypothetical protein